MIRPFCSRRSREGERGSALVIAMLMTVILTLLGISLLVLGETENKISQNEKLSAQALYMAEAAARSVKRWFDRPGGALGFPDPAVVDRTQRRIIDETDPYNAGLCQPADGAGLPFYKQGVDTDADGDDDLFERPYRGGLLHTLLGTIDGPDMLIDEASDAGKAYLTDLSQRLLADFPGERGRLRARIGRIALYAPPYVERGASWVRYGVATLQVIVRIYLEQGSAEQTLAEREIRVVLSEIPYWGAYGPLHSGGEVYFKGPLTAAWGPVTSERRVELTFDLVDIPLSLPRGVPGLARLDSFWTDSDATAFANWLNAPAVNNTVIEDPWLRVLTRGPIIGMGASLQPYPPGLPPPDCCDHSNLFQHMSNVSCPEYAYDVFKSVATSGGSDVHYYVWSGGTSFRENGTGPPESFLQITNGREGLFFFDTQDQLPPRDQDGDGRIDNLTPEILVRGADWFFRGFLYLNAQRFQIDRSPSTPVVLAAPGEPFQDADQDGRYDAGEAWVNLRYPASPSGAIVADNADSWGGSVSRNARGPELAAVPVSFHGILYTNGTFEASGTARYYGSVIAFGGVVQALGAASTPELYWDDTIKTLWPPAGWALPRTTVTSWVTER